MTLTLNNIKSELSYAVLHAVASQAGFACEVTGRHTDDMGIDAVVRVKEHFGPESVLTEFSLDFQLKATSDQLSLNDGHYSYSLKAKHYDKLRISEIDAPRFLALFMMPEDRAEWCEKSAEQLVCRRCLRWVSLRNAPEGNATATTVYVPENQVLTPSSLRMLADTRSKEEWIDYARP